MKHKTPKLKGIEFIFVVKIREISRAGEKPTPKMMEEELRITYRAICNIAQRLADKEVINKINDNWRVYYETTKIGERLIQEI